MILKEQSSTSKVAPKISLPNKELVGVQSTKNESAKLPIPTGWRLLVLPLNKKKKQKVEL